MRRFSTLFLVCLAGALTWACSSSSAGGTVAMQTSACTTTVGGSVSETSCIFTSSNSPEFSASALASQCTSTGGSASDACPKTKLTGCCEQSSTNGTVTIATGTCFYTAADAMTMKANCTAPSTWKDSM